MYYIQLGKLWGEQRISELPIYKHALSPVAGVWYPENLKTTTRRGWPPAAGSKGYFSSLCASTRNTMLLAVRCSAYEAKCGGIDVGTAP